MRIYVDYTSDYGNRYVENVFLHKEMFDEFKDRMVKEIALYDLSFENMREDADVLVSYCTLDEIGELDLETDTGDVLLYTIDDKYLKETDFHKVVECTTELFKLTKRIETYEVRIGSDKVDQLMRLSDEIGFEIEKK